MGENICQTDVVTQLREFTDEELVGFALANPQEGRFLLGLYCRYRSLVESIVASSQQAQVMAATVWVQVLRRLPTLNLRDKKFLNWLTVLSADVLTQVLRGNQKLLTNTSSYNPILLAYLGQALQQLPTPQRFLTILHDVYQWPPAQIQSWMADQQWTLPLTQINQILQQGHQLLQANLPSDLKNLCWNLQEPLEDQLRFSLQGLEFDPELERENYRQWYQQQATSPATALSVSDASKSLPKVAAVGLLVLFGGYLAWQGINTLTANLSTPLPTVSAPPPQPEPEVVSEPKAEANVPIPKTVAKPPQAEPNAPTPVKVTQPTPKPQPTKPKAVLPAQPTSRSNKTLAKVVVVASSADEIQRLRRQFPSSFPKTCPGGQCVQVGAFKTAGNAEELAGELRTQGFTVNVVKPS